MIVDSFKQTRAQNPGVLLNNKMCNITSVNFYGENA